MLETGENQLNPGAIIQQIRIQLGQFCDKSYSLADSAFFEGLLAIKTRTYFEDGN